MVRRTVVTNHPPRRALPYPTPLHRCGRQEVPSSVLPPYSRRTVVSVIFLGILETFPPFPPTSHSFPAVPPFHRHLSPLWGCSEAWRGVAWVPGSPMLSHETQSQFRPKTALECKNLPLCFKAKRSVAGRLPRNGGGVGRVTLRWCVVPIPCSVIAISRYTEPCTLSEF